ncbi:MAG: hypothetical protein HY240_02660 [Actinobacteria bacterium]|nr:hypothetical protein [Actinomycetota bacterium]
MQLRRPLVVLALTSFAILGFAQAARAQTSAGSSPLVVLTGSLEVKERQVVRDAVIFNGDAIIAGQVERSVVAFNGDVTVTGKVGENVVALNGRVTVASGAEVGGNVTSRLPPEVSTEAHVGGAVRQRSFEPGLGGGALFGRFALWLATSVSAFLLGLALILFAPRALDAAASTAVSRFGSSLGLGALLFVGLPVVAIIAMTTIVGLPLGLGVLLALGLVYWLGYTASAFAIGRQLVKPPTHRLLAYLVGWGILRVVALVPVLAAITWLAATVWGMGALASSARRFGRAEVSMKEPGPPPVPPMPA